MSCARGRGGGQRRLQNEHRPTLHTQPSLHTERPRAHWTHRCCITCIKVVQYQQEYDPNANLKVLVASSLQETLAAGGVFFRDGVFFPGRGGTTTTLRFGTRTSVDGAARCGRCG